MEIRVRLAFICLLSLLECFLVTSTNVEVRMPNVRPQHDDAYLCHAIKMDNGSNSYITGFVPHGNMAIAHHMLLYGCDTPGSNEPIWNCGEMAQAEADLDVKGICKDAPQIIYAWAMDAPALTLPKDVSFKVGHESTVKYIVLQVHYKDSSKFRNSATATDNSGITLTTQSTPTPKLAGVYILLTGGTIPAHSTVYMEAMCAYTGNAVLHPFAFRTHTHKLGQLVSGFRIRDHEWTELGRKSPQKPQMFYNTTESGLKIKPGDTLAARCIMKNSGNKDVSIGNTQADEMCNFYMMYWVYAKDDAQLSDESNQMCNSLGWPGFQWRNLISSIPDAAAIIPGTSEIIHEDNEMTKMMDRLEEENSEEDWIRSHFPVDERYPASSNPYDMFDEGDEFAKPEYEISPEDENEEDLIQLRKNQGF